MSVVSAQAPSVEALLFRSESGDSFLAAWSAARGRYRLEAPSSEITRYDIYSGESRREVPPVEVDLGTSPSVFAFRLPDGGSVRLVALPAAPP
ncbi:MAG: hypothetical protein HC888_18085 [Candidatus Competibacteraceae bacterium]|nr:hypothetical protein [Candidatus Competibacteraceae bacterium]